MPKKVRVKAGAVLAFIGALVVKGALSDTAEILKGLLLYMGQLVEFLLRSLG